MSAPTLREEMDPAIRRLNGEVFVRWLGISVAVLDRIWRTLATRAAENGEPWQFRGTKTVLGVTDCCAGTWATARKVFQAFDLVTYAPGTYIKHPEPDEWDECYSWLYLLGVDKDAWQSVWDIYTVGEPTSIYVASRSIEGYVDLTGSLPPVDDCSVARFARGERRPLPTWLVPRARVVGGVSLTPATISTARTNGRWPSLTVPDQPASVVLVPEAHTSTTERSEVTEQSSTDETFTYRDVMADQGCSRAQAFRRINNMLDTGVAKRARPGVYTRM